MVTYLLTLWSEQQFKAPDKPIKRQNRLPLWVDRDSDKLNWLHDSQHIRDKLVSSSYSSFHLPMAVDKMLRGCEWKCIIYLQINWVENSILFAQHRSCIFPLNAPCLLSTSSILIPSPPPMQLGTLILPPEWDSHGKNRCSGINDRVIKSSCQFIVFLLNQHDGINNRNPPQT